MRSVLLLTALLCAPALAQSALFLSPREATVTLGQSVTLEAVTDATATDWPDERTRHFFARTAWTQENRDALPPREDVETAASWTTDRPGVLLIGLDLAPRTERIAPDALAAFIAANDPQRELLTAPQGDRIEVVRHESAKALIRVDHEGPRPASIATSKTGQPTEIRPLMDPTALTPGSDLAVKLYARTGSDRQGVVTATNATTGDVVRAISGDSRIANIPIATAGRWRLEFHAAEWIGGEAPRYEIHTATLTFDVREVTK